MAGTAPISRSIFQRKISGLPANSRSQEQGISRLMQAVPATYQGILQPLAANTLSLRGTALSLSGIGLSLGGTQSAVSREWIGMEREPVVVERICISPWRDRDAVQRDDFVVLHAARRPDENATA